MGPIISTHYKLMGASDPRQVVAVIELFRNILSEGVPGTSRGDTPTTSVVRVRPEEITDGTFVGNLLDAVELSDLV